MTTGWVEVNIHLKDYKHTNAVLLNFVEPFVEYCKSQKLIMTWHFFREPEICLRFYGQGNEIAKTKQEINTKLIELEKSQPEVYERHVFGAHGVANQEYEGESDTWGKDWPIAMMYYEHGAETALRLLSSEPLDKPLKFHAQRYIHLFLNQIGYGHWEESSLHHEMEIGYLLQAIGIPALQSAVEGIQGRLSEIEKWVAAQKPEAIK